MSVAHISDSVRANEPALIWSANCVPLNPRGSLPAHSHARVTLVREKRAPLFASRSSGTSEFYRKPGGSTYTAPCHISVVSWDSCSLVAFTDRAHLTVILTVARIADQTDVHSAQKYRPPHQPDNRSGGALRLLRERSLAKAHQKGDKEKERRREKRVGKEAR